MAANQKTTQLPALDAIDPETNFLLVSDPGGTPVTNRVTYANLKNVKNVIPAARVKHDANQNVNNGAWTTLAFNTEEIDTDDIHDPVTNNSRLTCKTAGLYLITGNVLFEANSNGFRFVKIDVNAATTIAYEGRGSFNLIAWGISLTTMYELSINDYITIDVYQSSGGSIDVLTNSDNSPIFAMTRIG